MKNIFILFTISILSFGQKPNNQIKITHDKFEKTKTYDATAGALGFYFIKNDNEEDFYTKYLSITIYDDYLTHAKDLVLLFSDGTKLEFKTSEKIGENSTKGWRYSTLIYLNENDLKILLEKEIVDFKYHIFERKYTQGKKLLSLLKELLKQ